MNVSSRTELFESFRARFRLPRSSVLLIESFKESFMSAFEDLASTYEKNVANVGRLVQNDLILLEDHYATWRHLRSNTRSAELSSIQITQELSLARERLAIARARREESLISRLGPFDDGVGNDVHINCGGKHFVVTREILCRDKMSALAALCRKGGPPAAEGPGSSKEAPLFLDRDWVTFEQVLAFLSKGPSALPPSSDAGSLRSLYVESAFLMLTSLRDAIEDVLLASEEEENLRQEDSEANETKRENPDSNRQDALNSSISSSAFSSEMAALPSTPKRVQGAGKALDDSFINNNNNAPSTPKADVLIAAATAITRSRDVISSAAEGVLPDEDLAVMNASLRSPLRNTQSQSMARTSTGQTPQRFNSSLNSSMRAVDAPFSPAAAAMRRALTEMELDMLREPTKPTTSEEEKAKAAAAAAQSKKPTVMTTADYIGGTWKSLYAPSQSASLNPNSTQKGGESLVSKAAATALPDPFGFARKI